MNGNASDVKRSEMWEGMLGVMKDRIVNVVDEQVCSVSETKRVSIECVPMDIQVIFETIMEGDH